VSPAAHVVYAPGCAVTGDEKRGFPAAIQAAKNADVAVVVVGEQAVNHGPKNQFPPTDGEGHDVASLDLTGVQEDLVRAIQATGRPVALVLINGRPLSVRWEAEHVPAIVEAWLPGEAGGEAVADVLFGDANPSGRLAITIPRSSGQLPAYYNHKPSKAYWIDQAWTHHGGYVDMPGTPLYPFGFGLSYTQFQYSNLRIQPEQVPTPSEARVTVDVENTGTVAGVETAQLYLHERYAPVSTPVIELRGFERLTLEPGQKKSVSFTLGTKDFQLLDSDMHWVVVPGTFDIMVGKSAAEITLKGTLAVKGPNDLEGK
jgi:beta-glucosidase